MGIDDLMMVNINPQQFEDYKPQIFCQQVDENEIF